MRLIRFWIKFIILISVVIHTCCLSTLIDLQTKAEQKGNVKAVVTKEWEINQKQISDFYLQGNMKLEIHKGRLIWKDEVVGIDYDIKSDIIESNYYALVESENMNVLWYHQDLGEVNTARPPDDLDVFHLVIYKIALVDQDLKFRYFISFLDSYEMKKGTWVMLGDLDVSEIRIQDTKGKIIKSYGEHDLKNKRKNGIYDINLKFEKRGNWYILKSIYFNKDFTVEEKFKGENYKLFTIFKGSFLEFDNADKSK